MKFGDALSLMSRGKKVVRISWNDDSAVVAIRDIHPCADLEFVRFSTNGSSIEPWTPSIADIRADDWFDYELCK